MNQLTIYKIAPKKSSGSLKLFYYVLKIHTRRNFQKQKLTLFNSEIRQTLFVQKEKKIDNYEILKGYIYGLKERFSISKTTLVEQYKSSHKRIYNKGHKEFTEKKFLGKKSSFSFFDF